VLWGQHSEFSISPPRVRTTKDLQLSSKKDQILQAPGTDSESTEFRSSDYKENPTIKKKGSNLASFRNRFRTHRVQKLSLQGASSYQARRIRNCWALKRSQPSADQSSSAHSALSFRKESTTCRSGARSIQRSSAHSATFEIKRSHFRIIQVIRRMNERISALNSEIVLTFNINTKFNLVLISCLILFRFWQP